MSYVLGCFTPFTSRKDLPASLIFSLEISFLSDTLFTTFEMFPQGFLLHMAERNTFPWIWVGLISGSTVTAADIRSTGRSVIIFGLHVCWPKLKIWTNLLQNAVHFLIFSYPLYLVRSSFFHGCQSFIL